MHPPIAPGTPGVPFVPPPELAGNPGEPMCGAFITAPFVMSISPPPTALPTPGIPPCTEECERMLDERAKQIFEDRDMFNKLDDQVKQMIEDRVKQRNLTR
jgi:hypothetical protein